MPMLSICLLPRCRACSCAAVYQRIIIARSPWSRPSRRRQGWPRCSYRVFWSIYQPTSLICCATWAERASSPIWTLRIPSTHALKSLRGILWDWRASLCRRPYSSSPCISVSGGIDTSCRVFVCLQFDIRVCRGWCVCTWSQIILVSEACCSWRGSGSSNLGCWAQAPSLRGWFCTRPRGIC